MRTKMAREFMSLRLLASLVVLALTGCAAPAAMLLSPAVSGAPAVADFLGGDVSESFWAARQNDVVVAARRAGSAFELERERDEENAERVLLVFRDETGAQIRLRIELRTPVLTFIRFTGPAGLTRLMTRQIVDELNGVDAFLLDWTDGQGIVGR